MIKQCEKCSNDAQHDHFLPLSVFFPSFVSLLVILMFSAVLGLGIGFLSNLLLSNNSFMRY